LRLSDRSLALRYATAFVLAAGQDADRSVPELLRAQQALAPAMAFFRHPRLSSEQKKGLLAKALGEVSRTTRRFLELLIDKKRFGLLAQVAEDAGKVLDVRRGLLRADVRSAQALSEDELKALRERLGAFSGKSVELGVKVDAELLAGLSVRLGDWVLDGSLKGRLRRIRRRLTG